VKGQILNVAVMPENKGLKEKWGINHGLKNH
jgi:hypothetical protein